MNDIIINNSNVVFNAPPKKPFKKMWKVGEWRLYLTHNFRLKNSQPRDRYRHESPIIKVKEKKWEQTEGHCEICGKKIKKFGWSQIHHVLTWKQFPQFAADERNLMLLCQECHNQIHQDPFRQVKMINKKADELGVNLKDYYDV